MDGVLIVSSAEKGTDLISQLLEASGFTQIFTSGSGSDARRILIDREFDLIIINAPLRDESGENLSRQVASSGASQVMLLVKSEFFDAVSEVCEEDGVMTIAKPVSKPLFWSALKLARASQSRLKRAHAKNESLERRIEEIKIVDRAKCVLIANTGMCEQEAHRFIEKQAMDLRSTKRAVADRILNEYDH